MSKRYRVARWQQAHHNKRLAYGLGALIVGAITNSTFVAPPEPAKAGSPGEPAFAGSGGATSETLPADPHTNLWHPGDRLVLYSGGAIYPGGPTGVWVWLIDQARWLLGTYGYIYRIQYEPAFGSNPARMSESKTDLESNFPPYNGYSGFKRQ